MTIGENLELRLSIGDFVLDQEPRNVDSIVMLMDASRYPEAKDPEIKFQLIEYVVHQMLEQLHKNMTEGPTPLVDIPEEETDGGN